MLGYRQTPRGPPLLELLQGDGVNRNRILTRVERRKMHGPVRLRLRAAGILRDQSIHDVEHDFFSKERLGVKFGQTFAAKA